MPIDPHDCRRNPSRGSCQHIVLTHELVVVLPCMNGARLYSSSNFSVMLVVLLPKLVTLSLNLHPKNMIQRFNANKWRHRKPGLLSPKGPDPEAFCN